MPSRKPHPRFPLTPHKVKGWLKKYRGKLLYIPDPDPAKALAEFHRRARAIDAGKQPQPRQDPAAATVGDVLTRYVLVRREDKDRGGIKPLTYQDYVDALATAATVLGRDALVDDLTPDDFLRLYRRWEATLSAYPLGNNVQAVRSAFKFAVEQGWIGRPPRYGPKFVKPLRGRRKRPPLTPAQVRRLIRAARGDMKAVILLGINCAYGPSDIANLPRAAVDLKAGIIKYPRPKMERRRPIDRVATLWPESLEQLRKLLKRPAAPDGLVFHTDKGRKLVRVYTARGGRERRLDTIAVRFRELLDALGISRSGFYALRHLAFSLGAEMESPFALARILGHRQAGLAEVYLDHVEHRKLKAITDHVRKRVLG